MDPVGSWLSLGVSGLALIVAVLALYFSARQARAAERQAAHEEMKDGPKLVLRVEVVEGGPERWVVSNEGKESAKQLEFHIRDETNAYEYRDRAGELHPAQDYLVPDRPKRPSLGMTEFSNNPAVTEVSFIDGYGRKYTRPITPIVSRQKKI